MASPILRVNSTIKELLNQIAKAEVVCIDNELFVITKKADLVDLHVLALESNVEDFEVIFETDYHVFNWWEITGESKKLGPNQWQIGDSTLRFLTTVPL